MHKNITLFTEKLKKLCKKHNILLAGKIRLLELENYIPDSQTIDFAETIQDGIVTDRTGPFLLLYAEKKPQEQVFFNKARYNSAILNVNKDKLLENGVKSVIDGTIHTNRMTYGEHLKANNCTEVGNDYNNAKPKAESNYEFDDSGIMEATSRAVDEVFERKKIKTLR